MQNPMYSDKQTQATALRVSARYLDRVATSFSQEELAVMAFLWGLKPPARQKYFTRAGLGDYSPTNPIVKSLIDKRLVKVRGDGVIVVPDPSKLQAIMGQHEAPAKYVSFIPNAGIKFKVTAAQDMGCRVAARYFEERYARLLLAMSMGEALNIMGFPATSRPSPDEVSKAYKKKVFEMHPDRGGDPAKMVELNVAKDYLSDKTKSRPDNVKDYSYKRDTSAPRWQDDPETVYMKGQDFEAAMSGAGIPAGVEWKFISIPEWYWEKSFYPGHRIYTLYGQTDTKHVFFAIKERGESAGVIPTDMGSKTHVEEDWQTSEIDVPISANIAKIAPKYLKDIGTAWADAKPKPPRKFVSWPGGKPTKALIQKVPRSGGAALKDMLVAMGLLNDEDPSVVGRKSIVEIYTKRNAEKGKRVREEVQKKQRAEPSKRIYIPASADYDFFVRVNGKAEQLTDDTIENMNKRFIPWIMNNEVSEGRPFNLTRLRGGRMKYPASAAIQELADCITGEPSWLVIALQKAAEEYEENTKVAGLIHLCSEMTLRQASEVVGMTPFDLFNALHG